ncbi:MULTISPECIES: hypothetical protein [unclassified Bacillus (in: firmicutes)]
MNTIKDYYTIPKAVVKRLFLEPFACEIEGKEGLMTSIAVPRALVY